MMIVVGPAGQVRCLYSEAIDLTAMGLLSIRRGSHVEPDATGQWYADLSPVAGPRLGPFPSRSLALQAEVTWLEEHWLLSRDGSSQLTVAFPHLPNPSIA